MNHKQREGVVVEPHKRLTDTQVRLIDGVSRDLLQDPGILCYNSEAAEQLKQAGAKLEDAQGCVRVRIPANMIDKALSTAPSTVVLGAREPDNRLILNAEEPRVRFGSGSETNVWLDVDFDDTNPVFTRREGSIELLKTAAHLCNNLENLDFFIRCVNIRDAAVTEDNKDVNKFLASLNNTTRHVQAGLTSIKALDDVIRMGSIITGSEQSFVENPVLSFIACVMKSPLQMVDDTATTMMEVARRRVPIVISSCPMAGATGPFDEFGMVAQINAELLAGIVLHQIVSPGAPVLYGSVPVRTRLDNLNDMYGAPEFNHYNLDCTQMACYYKLPCYSTAGVADTSVPGIQATFEKMLTLMSVPFGGAQYVHYAFGLLERTNVFCPVQAVLDDAHIGTVKRSMAQPPVDASRVEEIASLIREVMQSDHKTYIYNLPLPTRDPVYPFYPFEDDAGALAAALRRYHEILDIPRNHLPEDVLAEIKNKVPGVLNEAMSR